MKNHKYMLAMLLSSSLLVGCQGDFLNLPSETSLSTAVYYKSQSDFEQQSMVLMLLYAICITGRMEHGRWAKCAVIIPLINITPMTGER